MSLNKHTLLAISLTAAEEASGLHLLASSRPVVLYLGPFLVRGDLHVSVEAVADDLLDETRDFHAVSRAHIFPISIPAIEFAREAPLLFVRRGAVQGYHLYEE
jgi:hypothetical protein